MFEASLLNPFTSLRFPTEGAVLFKVDTGFRGGVMVTADVFAALGAHDFEVPDVERPVYTTVAGPLVMRSAPAFLQIATQTLEVDVLTPAVAVGRMLIGFEVLRELNVGLLRTKACRLESR